jgi:hypothetical protein
MIVHHGRVQKHVDVAVDNLTVMVDRMEIREVTCGAGVKILAPVVDFDEAVGGVSVAWILCLRADREREVATW